MKEAWRAIAYTLAISIAFVALQRGEVAFFDRLAGLRWVIDSGVVDRHSAADLAREAASVADASRPALERLPPATRRAVFRLGYSLGFAAQLSGSLLMSAAASREQARPIVERRVAAAQGLANALQLGDVTMLPVASLSDFAALNQRIDDDENGVAARIERQLSPVHRHLYQLGAQLGTEGARVESTRGELFGPETLRIRRHATLAGVPEALWQAVGSAKADTPALTVERFHAAVDAIDASLSP